MPSFSSAYSLAFCHVLKTQNVGLFKNAREDQSSEELSVLLPYVAKGNRLSGSFNNVL